jgi:hypothetical protein
MTATTVEDLKARQAELRERERKLADEFRACEAGDAAGRDRVRKAMDEVAGEIAGLGPRIAAAKEERKKEGLLELLSGDEYQQALLAACEGLAATLEPWQPLYKVTVEAQRRGFAAPAMPPTIGILFAEASDWLTRLCRRGVLSAKTLPPPLRLLVKEEADR